MPHLTLVEKGSSRTHRVNGEAVVGRDPSCGIIVEGDTSKTVSGRHARFFLDDGKWFVEDAGSRNGTYVGARRLEPGARHPLAVGDVVGLGVTGTQLAVQEALGQAFAATMLESAPIPRPVPTGTIPAKRADQSDYTGPDVRVVLRAVSAGTRWTGHSSRVTIGRALECIIRVEGEAATSVSRVHAEIVAANGRIVLRDAGSRHGTFLNGARLDGPAAIRPGDVIMLGAGGPTFEIDEAEIIAESATAAAPTSAGIKVTPPGAARSLPPHDSQEFFQAQLPTPAFDRPAFKAAEKGAAEQARRAKSSASIQKAARQPPPRLRSVIIVAAAAAAAAAIAAVFAVERVSRTRSNPADANANVAQQAAALDSARAAAIAEATGARASLDSATAAGAQPAVLDSLRKALDDAGRRAARLDDSARKKP